MPKRQNKDEHFWPALWSMTTSYTEGLSFFSSSGDSLYSLLNEAAWMCFICSLVTASMSLSTPNYTRQICGLNFMQQNHRNLCVYVHVKLLVILQFQLQSQSKRCKTDFTKLNCKILLEIKEKQNAKRLICYLCCYSCIELQNYYKIVHHFTVKTRWPSDLQHVQQQ